MSKSTPKSIGVVGNSQITCLAHGWRKVRDEYPSTALTFYGAVKGEIARLVKDGDRLVSPNERGREWLRKTSGQEFIPAHHDEYWVVGSGVGLDYIHRIFKSHGTIDTGPSRFLASDAVVRATAKAVVRESQAAKAIELIRSISGAPITLLPSPFISETAIGEDNWRYVRNEAALGMALSLYQEHLDLLGVDVAEQPPETIARAGFTKAEYFPGAVNFRTDEVLPADDYIHLNAAFGVAYLRQLLSDSGKSPSRAGKVRHR